LTSLPHIYADDSVRADYDKRTFANGISFFYVGTSIVVTVKVPTENPTLLVTEEFMVPGKDLSIAVNQN